MRTIAITHLPFQKGTYAADDFLFALGLCDTLPFAEHQRPLRYTKPIDVVILGPNDEQLALYDTTSLGRIFGEEYSWEQGGRSERLRPFMGRNPSATVLLLPSSRSAYPTEVRARLKRSFPRVTWLMPPVQDYHDCPMSRRIIEDLRAAELLERA